MKKIHVALLSVVAVGFAVVLFAVAVSAPRGAQAATVAFDAVGPSAGTGASCTSCKTLSWSHVVGASGTSRLVVVGVSIGGPNSGTTQTATATYGGAAMTLVASTSNDSSKNGKALLFYLANPPTGTSTVAVGITGNTPGTVIGGSISFTGVNSTLPVRNAKTASGRSAAASVNVSSTPGDMVVDIVSYGTNGTTKSGTGETQRWLKDINSNTGGSNGAQSTAPGANSVTMSYTIPNDEWGIVAMDIVAGSASTSTPLVISAVSSTNITTNSAVITWTTNETSTSQVAYGTSTNYSATTTLDGTFVTSHSVMISGLSSSTLYHYQVRSSDFPGNQATSSDATFTTSAIPDTTPPSVPANLVATPISSSQINLTWATSTDNVGVAGYQVFQNGSQIATTTIASYSNIGLAASTTYMYNVTAFDAAGNISAQSAPAVATTPLAPDATAPTVSMTAPAPSSTVSGTSTTISATATDPIVFGQVTSGVASVQFLLDGSPLGAPVTSSPYSIVWDTTGVANGTHALSARATDVAGNATTSAAVTVIVNNVDTIAPSVPTGLTATPVSSSQINLAWASSTDNVGVAGYQVFRNGIQVASSTLTSYADIGLTASTTYTYNVTAFDNAGNISAQSAPAVATTPAVSTSSVPTLVQSVGFMSNEDDDPGNNFKFSLPNPVLSGNFVGIAVTYASGTPPTITDNKGTNTWVDAINCSAATTWLPQKYSLYYSLNTAPGTQTFTVTFPTNGQLNVNIHAVEFMNIAAANALDGSACTMGVASPNVDSGAITTTQNGDLIWNYVVDEYNGLFGQNHPISSITFGGNFTGLYADQGLGDGAQYAIQPVHGVIHATSTWAQTTHDNFASIAIALKAAPVGTMPGPGIRIIREEFFEPGFQSSPFTFPCSGNLIVAQTSEGSYNEDNLASITSTPANTWTKINPSVNSPYLFHADSATCSSALHGTINITGAVDEDQFVFYDITGAATSPIDTAATCPTPSTTGGAGTGSCINTGAQSTPNQDTTNSPNITPSTAHGLVLSEMNDGVGPTTGSTNSSYTYDLVSYPGATDTSWFNWGDGISHVYNADTTALNFGYHWANGQTTNWNAMATAFKAAGN